MTSHTIAQLCQLTPNRAVRSEPVTPTETLPPRVFPTFVRLEVLLADNAASSPTKRRQSALFGPIAQLCQVTPINHSTPIISPPAHPHRTPTAPVISYSQPFSARLICLPFQRRVPRFQTSPPFLVAGLPACITLHGRTAGIHVFGATFRCGPGSRYRDCHAARKELPIEPVPPHSVRDIRMSSPRLSTYQPALRAILRPMRPASGFIAARRPGVIAHDR